MAIEAPKKMIFMNMDIKCGGEFGRAILQKRFIQIYLSWFNADC